MKDKHGHVVISAICRKRNCKSLYHFNTRGHLQVGVGVGRVRVETEDGSRSGSSRRLGNGREMQNLGWEKMENSDSQERKVQEASEKGTGNRIF